MRSTDRAFRLTAAYLNTYAEPKRPLPDTRMVYNTVSGEVDVEFPLNSDGTSNKTYLEIALRSAPSA